MQINISQAEQDKLVQLAADAGFESVERFVTEHVRCLAHHPAATQFAPLNSEELRASLEMCDRGMAEIDADGGCDAKDAMLDLGQKRGFTLDG